MHQKVHLRANLFFVSRRIESQEWMKSRKLVLNAVLILLRYSLSNYFLIYPVLPLLTRLAVSWLKTNWKWYQVWPIRLALSDIIYMVLFKETSLTSWKTDHFVIYFVITIIIHWFVLWSERPISEEFIKSWWKRRKRLYVHNSAMQMLMIKNYKITELPRELSLVDSCV